MQAQERQAPVRWAPWWLYVIAIVVTNQIRTRWLMPDDLAVIDSINPSALLATIVLLLRGRRARPLVAVYVVAVLATYLAIGVALTLGLGLTPQALIHSDAAYLVQGVLGAVMLAYAVVAPGRRRQPGDLAVAE